VPGLLSFASWVDREPASKVTEPGDAEHQAVTRRRPRSLQARPDLQRPRPDAVRFTDPPCPLIGVRRIVPASVLRLPVTTGEGDRELSRSRNRAGRDRPALRALAALTATAAVAAATAAPTAGSERATFPLSFIGVYQDGTPVKVKKFTFSGAPVQCAEGPATYSPARPLPRMKVKKHLQFSGTVRRKGVTTRVTGKYKRDLSAVTGTLKVRGKVSGYTRCRSGKLRWKTD